MARIDRSAITLDDDETRRIHATWSRSGKRLILSIHKTGWSDAYQQVQLRPEQVEELREFLDQPPPD
jgi:hypothetical protein